MEKQQRAAQIDVFHAIADPTRRGLLDLIAKGERPVKELAQAFAMSRPAISQHLRVLEEAGLIVEKRVGREHHYRLNPAPLSQVSDWLQPYQQFWQQHLNTLGDYLNNMDYEYDE